MRHITAIGLALIQHFEGFCPTIYLCPSDVPTIGYGHVVQAEERPRFLGGITEAEALALLRRDVEEAERSVLRLISVPLTDGQFDALVSFTYNVGSGALQRSTLRQKINRGESQDAPRELQRWVWGRGRKLPGLVRRRQSESFRFVQ